MQSTRAGGTITMGILNIIFGSLGGLIGLFFVIVGRAIASGGAAMETEMGAEAEGLAEFGAIGGILALIGVIPLVFSVVLFVAGIGLLKMAPWGRMLSIVCGFGLIGLNVLFMLFGGIHPFTIMGLGYGIILAGLCFSESWKQAYSSNAQASGFEAAPVGVTGFAGMPATPAPTAADPMSPMATPQPQSTPNPMPMNEETAPAPAPGPAPGFASMPGIPSPPATPEASLEAPPKRGFDVGDDPDENISDVAA